MGGKKTIRELGGEFWAELEMRIRDRDAALKNFDHVEVNAVVDLLMGVLARHDGAIIENDADLPVPPLPQRR